MIKKIILIVIILVIAYAYFQNMQKQEQEEAAAKKQIKQRKSTDSSKGMESYYIDGEEITFTKETASKVRDLSAHIVTDVRGSNTHWRSRSKYLEAINLEHYAKLLLGYKLQLSEPIGLGSNYISTLEDQGWDSGIGARQRRKDTKAYAGTLIDFLKSNEQIISSIKHV